MRTKSSRPFCKLTLFLACLAILGVTGLLARQQPDESKPGLLTLRIVDESGEPAPARVDVLDEVESDGKQNEGALYHSLRQARGF